MRRLPNSALNLTVKLPLYSVGRLPASYFDAGPLRGDIVSRNEARSGNGRNIPLDLLRTLLVLLVVAHHAVLACHPYAPPREPLGAGSMAWTAFLIVDNQRWPGIEEFVHFSDMFFTSLMLLIAGVFSWSSFVRKGAAGLRDCGFRLGLPFFVSAGLVAPMGYYATYLVADPAPHLGGFGGMAGARCVASRSGVVPVGVARLQCGGCGLLHDRPGCCPCPGTSLGAPVEEPESGTVAP